MNEKLLVVSAAGEITALYDDALLEFGTVTEASRASNVEPGVGGGWDVVLTDNPRNGQYRGYVVARGVPRREDALALEVAFIQTHILR